MELVLRKKKRDQKGKETVRSSSCWLSEDETADGLGANGSGMGIVLEVVVTGGIGGSWKPWGGLGIGNWERNGGFRWTGIPGEAAQNAIIPTGKG